jgi:Lon protease-like protein
VLAGACTALKVFPLPGVVLLPGAPVPFHVFEPRYRALFQAALKGDRVVAVPTLRDASRAMEERPLLLPMAGLGVIVGEHRNDDGTLDVVLHGAGRVRLGEELSRGAPYREFTAELVEDVYPSGGAAALTGDLEALCQLCYELVAVLPPESGIGWLAEEVARLRDPAAMVDLVAAAALSEPAVRYRALATHHVAERLALVDKELAGLLLLLGKGRGTRN